MTDENGKRVREWEGERAKDEASGGTVTACTDAAAAVDTRAHSTAGYEMSGWPLLRCDALRCADTTTAAAIERMDGE